MGYREPTLEDRTKSAAAAREKALAKLRAKPQPTPEELAERRAAQDAKDAAEAERREAKKAEQARVKAEAAEAKAKAKREAEEAAAAEALAKLPKKPNIVMLTEEERKAARDARYAARKARK